MNYIFGAIFGALIVFIVFSIFSLKPEVEETTCYTITQEQVSEAVWVLIPQVVISDPSQEVLPL